MVIIGPYWAFIQSRRYQTYWQYNFFYSIKIQALKRLKIIKVMKELKSIEDAIEQIIRIKELETEIIRV